MATSAAEEFKGVSAMDTDDTEPLLSVRHPDFNVKAQLSKYSGYGKIRRAEYIFARSAELRVAALEASIEEIKKTCNVDLCVETVTKARQTLGKDGEHLIVDEEWMKQANKRYVQKLGLLESEANQRKTKDALKNIALLLADRGDFQGAISKLLEARDYAASAADQVDMYFWLARISFHAGQLQQIKSQISRAQSFTNEIQQNKTLDSQLHMLSGVCDLRAGRLHAAADAFLKARPLTADIFNDVISVSDLPIYGGLCALASYDRNSLRQRLLENENFRKCAELAPHVLSVAKNIINCNYAAAFQTLKQYENDWLLDINLGPYLYKIISQIRERAIVQYFHPYSSIAMSQMASAFSTDLSSLERELVHLIADNKIQARIDSHNKVLYAKNSDQRLVTVEKALTAGNTFVRDAKSALLRANVIRSGILFRGLEKARKKGKEERDLLEIADSNSSVGGQASSAQSMSSS